MRRQGTALWPFVAWGVFVVYGSLVPLEFRPVALDVAWQRFQHAPFLDLGLDSRADWVANGVLYVPLAFLGARLMAGLGLPRMGAAALAAGACCALAVAVEFAQLFFPARTVSQNDILAECIGSAFGALAAPALAGRVDRLALAWQTGGARLLPRLLELYSAAYVLLCFFPYDLLLSAAEIQGKLRGGGWGWWLAPHGRGLFMVVLQLAVEVALALPMGAMLAAGRAGRARGAGGAGDAGRADAGHAGRASWLRAAAVGLLLGGLIEVGQFFVASGVSQGASVLSRVLGVMTGAALLPGLRAAGLRGVRAALQPWSWPLGAAYLVLLAAANGAFRYRWHGVEAASASWHATHWLPFWYHYYTSEALALLSLCSVSLMYLPVAVLGWARRWPARWTLAAAALLATAVETGKLFVEELHADPTNILVAVAGVAALSAAGSLAERDPAPAEGAMVQPRSPLPSAPAARPLAPAAGLLALPAVALWALWFPAFPLALLSLLTVCGLLVWRWPALALVLVPAALPALDLAPWSGRFYLDEFDLLQAVCLAVAFHRTPAPLWRRAWQPLDFAFALLALSLAASTLRAGWPLSTLSWPDDNSFSSYTSAWNAVRIVKGGVWALLFVRLWQRLPGPAARRLRLFGAGMTAGLALVVACVVWERAVFAGWWDFAVDFRVTGPFSAMHKGGAYIECYLAVATAFAVDAVLRPGRAAARAGALLLAGGACYAMMVTYSRNGYAALAAVLALSLLAQVTRMPRRPPGPPAWARAGWGALLLALVAAVAIPIAGGSYARQRLARSGADLEVRRAHWADGLSLRDRGPLTALLGMGLGRFPDTHFWRSREATHAASYRLVREGNGLFLRLTEGSTLYIDQIIPHPATPGLRLALELRAPPGQAAFAATLCEKWTLSSLDCVDARIAVPPGGGWQAVEHEWDLARLPGRLSRWHAPLKLSLLTPGKGVLDVRNVHLRTASGDELLHNGDFAHGMDRWFFATDVDPPWHLHSLPVAVLFDQGWFGVLAWAAVLLAAAARAVRGWPGGSALAPAALAALAGFAVSAALNTLIDAPRFLWLLLVLLWLAAESAESPADPAAAPAAALRGPGPAPA